MAQDQDESIEQIVEGFISEHRGMIARELGPIREWMMAQSAADRVDMTLSAVQREMAIRVFKRCSHSGSRAEQASDMELDSYYCDARLLRELVPPALESAHHDIENAGRDIRILRTFRRMTMDEIVNLAS